MNNDEMGLVEAYFVTGRRYRSQDIRILTGFGSKGWKTDLGVKGRGTDAYGYLSLLAQVRSSFEEYLI
jgi:hypothetical protein